ICAYTSTTPDVVLTSVYANESTRMPTKPFSSISCLILLIEFGQSTHSDLIPPSSEQHTTSFSTNAFTILNPSISATGYAEYSLFNSLNFLSQCLADSPITIANSP